MPQQAACHPDKRYYARGLCRSCYRRLYRSPAFTRAQRPPRMIPTCHPERPHHGKGLCKACYKAHHYRTNPAYRATHREADRRWREANAEKDREIARRWKAANPEKVRALQRRYQRRKQQRIRGEALAVLGGRCHKCGQDAIRLLEVDHVKGNGTHHRKGDTSNYWSFRDWKRRGWPKDEAQLLCRPCHRYKTKLDRLSGKHPYAGMGEFARFILEIQYGVIRNEESGIVSVLWPCDPP